PIVIINTPLQVITNINIPTQSLPLPKTSPNSSIKYTPNLPTLNPAKLPKNLPITHTSSPSLPLSLKFPNQHQ
ncbi:hypothetical protein, partial [Staphylococcus saprophyticus]|uniref:hypothetical protein n=1 Tax=Staphylococcus saprophyticus TaxID=29385 RepID=UPI001C92F917